MAAPWDRYAAPAAAGEAPPAGDGPWTRYQQQQDFGTTVRRQHAPPETWSEYGLGLASNILQGGSFNTADEIEAYLRSKFQGADYDQAVAEIRRQNEAFTRRNPVTSFAAQTAGSLPLLAMGPGGAAVSRVMAGARSLPGAAGRSAGIGGGVGAAYGAGGANEGERIQGAIHGGVLGAGLGAALPPVLAGAGRAADVAARYVAPRSALGRRASEMPPGEPPVPPQGAQYAPGGQQTGAIQWIDERTGIPAPPGSPPVPPNQPALNASDRSVLHLSDEALAARGGRAEVEATLARLERENAAGGAYRYHTDSFGPDTSTLMEDLPFLARTLGAAARQNKGVGDDAARFFAGRQTGITPQGTTPQALAQRGVPTRERFAPPVRMDQSEAVLGRQFGPRTVNRPVSMGARERTMESVGRMLQIADRNYHGFAAAPDENMASIIARQSEAASADYKAAMTANAGVNLRPALERVLKKWADDPAMDVDLFRSAIRKISKQLLASDKKPVTSLETFDTAKKAIDDIIGKMRAKNTGNVAGKMGELKNELIAAVDNATGGDASLYKAARNKFAGEAESRNIMTAYRDLVKDVDPNVNFTPGREHFFSLSPEQQKLAKDGILWGFQDLTKGTDFNRSVFNRFNNASVNELISQLAPRTAEFRPETFGRFLDTEAQAAKSFQTALGGSPTAKNQQDDLVFEAMQAFGNVQQAVSLLRGSTGVLDFVGRGIQRIIERSFGFTADSARETGRMLLTADPNEKIRILRRMVEIMPADRMQRFNELMASFARYVSTTVSGPAGGAAGQSQQQPPRPQPTFL
jgi:hypothetical protein